MCIEIVTLSLVLQVEGGKCNISIKYLFLPFQGNPQEDLAQTMPDIYSETRPIKTSGEWSNQTHHEVRLS